MSKVLEKIQKKLEKLDALHAKEESLIESIKEMINDELDEDDDWDDGEEQYNMLTRKELGQMTPSQKKT